MMKNNRTKKIIWSGIIILILILAISLGFLIYNRIFSAKVSILVAPSIAKVKIGEAEFSSSEEIKIQPGEYEVLIFAEGFKNKTGRLVAKADETANLHVYLESSSENTKNWYEEHDGDALIMGEIKSAERLDELNKFLEKEPVLKNLPLTVEYYADNYSKYVKYIISYELDNSERGFYLIMKDYTGEGSETAFLKLKEMGLDLTGLKLEYQDLAQERLNFRAE